MLPEQQTCGVLFAHTATSCIFTGDIVLQVAK